MLTLYLKSLEIQGFKSFPTITRLTFEKPVTGIVGPNGSGKSNIADAILWVMGEQSTKTLRGGKMEDVIFGGTQRRAQVGFAEVSLILDNTDERLGLETSEIMLTRRYFRSGESEYYINQSLVRLKDMSELLMDTGLGREGYCIIGQGRISEILSTKSKDRREIFEEAAGISRYRHRKDESERKLQQTEDNLLRIGDKISELEMSIDPLREQAEIARRYLLLRDELRGIEISLWLRELDSLRVRAEKAEADHFSATQSLDAATYELESIFTKSESLAEKNRESEIEAESVRGLISATETRHNEAESSIAVLKAQLVNNAGQIENLSQEIQSQDDHQDSVGLQINDRESRLSEIEQEKAKKDDCMNSLVSELGDIVNNTSESGEEQSKLLKKESSLQTEHSNRKSELSALASQAQELYDMDNSVKQELAAANENLGEQEKEYTDCKATLEKNREEVTTLVNIVNGLAMKLQSRSKKSETAGETLDRLTFELKTLESRYNLLTEMEKEYQGYSKSVKLVMQEHSRGALKNVHGTVGSLIKTGDNYTIAIETALGGALQNIIVDTEEDGKTAINFLKRRDGGRATFLPLSTIKGSTLNNKEFSNDSGFEGIAIDLVKFDPKYSGVYNNLLGRVIIADNLNNAVKIAKNHGHRFKIVTLDGQVMNVGGSMTGGSTAMSAGVLSRANELEQLVGRIKSSTADLTKAQREHSECVREKNAAEYELQTASAELRAAEEEVLKQEIGETHRKQLLEASKEAIITLEDEIKSITQRIKLNTTETESLKALISGIETEAKALRELIEDAIRGHELLASEHERVNALLSEHRAEVAALNAERDAHIKAVSELSVLRDEMYGSRERQLVTIDGLKEKNEQICEEIKHIEQTAETIFKEIDSHRERLSKLNERKLDIEAKRNELTRSSHDMNEKTLKLQKECSRLEQRKQAAEMEEKQIIDKLWDTYELTRSAAQNAGTPIESNASAQKRISGIKEAISDLGTPNIGAIDEFDRVSTRYDFLTSQRDDVEKAKSELLRIINDITSHMRVIFIREFAVINESFEKTFKELFGGGRASLVLEDPEDVLNCGIEIQVQPPGKSLKTITLLSGGEKAFVAIAIYFAILSVRPPPFIVMDEIDAALDDANVLRFADHMRRISEKTQILVISHKRGTMEEADVLYGVTMQELGVSSIISIDLDEAEKHMSNEKTGNGE